MIFPSDKRKELWRYASKNNQATCDGQPSQQPQPHHHRHQRHLQNYSYQQQQQQQQQQMHQQCLESPMPTMTSYSIGCCCCCENSSTTASSNVSTPSRHHQMNTPPPPYQSVASGLGTIDYADGSLTAGMCSKQQTVAASYQMADGDTEISASSATTECSVMENYTKGGCSCASSGDDMYIDEVDPSNDSHFLQNYQNFYNQEVKIPPHQQSLATAKTMKQKAVPTQAASQTSSTFAMTAANVFRNCCGGGFFMDSSTSSTTTSTSSLPSNNHQHQQYQNNTNNNNHNGSPRAKIAGDLVGHHQASLTTNKWPGRSVSLKTRSITQDFNMLMKQLKAKQIAELLRAVKSRLELPTSSNVKLTGGAAASSRGSASVTNYSQCILIKRSQAMDEEQYVTVCRLFFWSDLRNASDLKRLPICSSECDRVYICCNPLHWCRIIETPTAESAPPPYQRSKMLRLRNTCQEENGQKPSQVVIGSSGILSSQSQSSISTSTDKPPHSVLYARIPESLTTDGEANPTCSMIWCQIAYWELAQRVGAFYHAKKPSVNIYAEGAANNIGEGMCLKDLAEQKSASDAVQHTRQKIGLGVTLSLDIDGVWVYNRASVPIFVDSPTLSEAVDRVYKVLPGYCLKAFDKQRAQNLNPEQVRGHQLGPIDRYSMKISFAKGWGHTYRRQDIMGCPCWLEVHFIELR